MRFARLALLALLALAMPSAMPAQEADVVVSGGVYRTEIERILQADNVDTTRLSSREVAEAIDGIGRGRAPEDFWVAYRAHVAAWDRLADTEEQGAADPEGAAKAMQAEQAIEATFDEVERIARGYGARLPTPPWQIPPTV
jgi:hypothetical protein